jgi:inhibitor of cysteine peptidase
VRSAKSLGYEIRWSGENSAVYAVKDGESIMFDLKNNQITANDHTYYMGGDYLGTSGDGYTMVNGKTYMRADLFAELGLDAQWDKSGKIVSLLSIEKNTITIKTVKQNSEDDMIKITLQYPRIEGLEDQAVQDSISSIFEKEAMQARDEGLRNADELKELKSSGGITSPNKCETYFDYSVNYNQNGLLSVVFIDYQYTGGAHGLTLQTAFTLDLKTGKEYRLKRHDEG